MTAIGILGILIAFVMVILLTYKGMNLAYVVLLACFVVLVTNGMPILETFQDPILTGVASQIPALLPLYLFGGLLGKLYLDSGASQKLSNTLLDWFCKGKDAAQRCVVGFFIVVGIGALFGFVGIDPYATLFIMIGIGTGVCFSADIPRRYLPVMLILGTTLGSAIPGSSSAVNVICMNFLEGTNALSGWIPGIIYCVLLIGLSFFYIRRQLHCDTKQGVGFEYGPLRPPGEIAEGKYPPFALTLIPLFVIPITANTICRGYTWAAMAIGCAVAVVCFGKFIPKKEGSTRFMTVVDSLNDGVTLAGVPAVILLNFGLGYAIQAAPSFVVIQDFFLNMQGPSLMVLAIAGIVLLGLSASMSGMIIVLGMAAPVFVPQLGLDSDAVYRVILSTNTVLDTLPFNAAVVTLFMITGIKYKEGYPLVFRTTVIYTCIGTFVVAGLLTLFPMLA
ncbi:MAG: GntP family permease [Eubacterium sp.]|nr:GntP family permease [Eubacterium sp.]